MSNLGAMIIAAAIFFGCFLINIGITSVSKSIDFAVKTCVRQ